MSNNQLGFQRELTYESLAKLEEAYEEAVKTLDYNNQSICNKLLKMHDRAVDLMKLGDAENAYGLMLRFMTAVALLKKSAMYKKDRRYVDTLISAQKIESCLTLLETMRPELKARYETQKLKKSGGGQEDTIAKSTTPAVEKKSTIEDVKSQISPQELIDLIQRSTHSILIIDTRPKTEFDQSQMNLDLLIKKSDRVAYVNIASELINEVSWRIFEELRSHSDTAYEAHVFGKRQTYDLVVLLDQSSDLKSAKNESKLLTLKRALYDYDQEKVKREPIILNGGYAQWHTLYPGYTRTATAPGGTNTPSGSSPIDSPKTAAKSDARMNSVYNFDYPSIEEKFKPSPLTTLPPPPQQVSNGVVSSEKADAEKATINRDNESINDSIRANNKLNIVVDPSGRQSEINKAPSIDRSMKPVINKRLPPEPPTSDNMNEQSNNAQQILNNQLSNMKIDPVRPPTLPSEPIIKRPSIETKELDEQRVAPNVPDKVPPPASQIIPSRVPSVAKPNMVVSGPPRLDEAAMFDSNSILNSVYMPPSRANRLIQTRDGTNKQLNPDTGLFSYIPSTDRVAAPTRQPQPPLPPLAGIPKQPPKPVSTSKPVPPPKFESNMKRTFSSPNIAQLESDSDEEDEDDQLRRGQELRRVAVTSVASKSVVTPSNQVPVKPPPPPSTKPTMPLVDRYVKPMSEQMLRSRIQELQPVYGNAHPGLVGLRNLGNSCFMNSIIQCLSSTKDLVSFFLTDKYRKDLNRSNHLGFGGEIADEFAVIVQAIWGGYCKIISPRRFKSLIGQFNQQFVSNDQQDAQELLLSLLDGLHEDLNRVTERPKLSIKDEDDEKEERLSDREAAGLAWRRHLMLNNSIIVDLFQGQFKSSVTCLSCNKSSRRFDAFMYLTLPLPSSKCNIYQCIDMFLQPENMMGESKWKCPRCKQYREAVKKIDIWQLPPILIVHLKRFKYQGIWRDKVTTLVDYPIGGENGVNLNLDPYVINKQQNGNNNNQYKLYAVSNHTGTLDGGHYTAVAKNFQFNRWFKYDDAEVKEASAGSLSSSLVSSASYILFYSRC